MQAEHNRIAELIIKHLKGDLVSHEQSELDLWINSSEKQKTFFQQLDNHNHIVQQLKVFYSYDEDEGWEKIRAQYPMNGSPVIPMKRSNWWRIAVAASILILAGVGSYFAFFNKSSQPDTANLPKQEEKIKDNITPGREGAILTLSTGQQVILDSVANGLLAQEGDIKLEKKEGQVIYNSQLAANNSQLAFNTMTTPRGRQYSLILSDGSKVWLNASSSVTYPTAFTGNERKVTVTGEAYFEIAHNPSKPFIVEKGDASVRVLGTHFNVNAYDDEEVLEVSLLEGSVRLNKASISILLKPGQQGQIDKAGAIRLKKDADMEESIAWKNGFFNFNSADIQNIMRQISRWYDVNVVYEGPVSQKHFTGIVSRKSDITHVLKIMEQAGIKFKLEGNKIIVVNK